MFGTSPESRSFIPAAFGDFNSDKLTDLVVLKNDRLAVEVLLAREQKVVSSGSDPPLFHGRPSHNLECNAPEGKIVSHAPFFLLPAPCSLLPAPCSLLLSGERCACGF